MRVENQLAYLIHSRKYTDSKLLVDLLTKDYGRVSAVMRYSSKSKKTMAQPFSLISCSWYGQSSLKTLTQSEFQGAAKPLVSETLYCGIYLNELVQRCLPQEDPCEEVFHAYERALSALASPEVQQDRMGVEQSLRRFEFQLIESLGFAIDFESDVHQNPISEGSGQCYAFIVDEGFVPLSSNENEQAFPADIIVAIKHGVFEREVLTFAKRLTRAALRPVLGDKPLKARELFQ